MKNRQKRETVHAVRTKQLSFFYKNNDTIKCICINKERTMKKLTSMYKRYMFHPTFI